MLLSLDDETVGLSESTNYTLLPMKPKWKRLSAMSSHEQSSKRFTRAVGLPTILLILGVVLSLQDIDEVCSAAHIKSINYATGIRERTNAEQLVIDLLTGYNPLLRPVYNDSTTTDLEMLLLVSQILNMDERMQKLNINAWVTLIWQDEFLVWDPENYGGLKGIKLSSNQVWLPQVILYNNADEYKDFLEDHIVKVDENGTMLWAAPVIFHSNCQVNVRNFPFDHQECELKFGPWQYSGAEINISGIGDDSVFTTDGEWDMVGLTAQSNTEYYPDDPGVPYTDVTYQVTLRRRPLFHIINLLLPCGLLTVGSMLVFFLPVDSGEKLSFGITILLSLTVFLLLLAESMPPSSVIPLVGQFYAISVVLVTLSVTASTIVVNLHHSGPNGSKVSPWAKKWIIRRLGTLFGFKSKSEAEMTSKEKMKLFKSRANVEHFRPLDSPPSPLLPRNSPEVKFSASRVQMQTPCQSELKLIFKELKHIRAYFDNKAADDHERNEWHLLAMIIDRCCLVIYAIFIAICSALITVFG
ncbi:neuronal acetylcholine receptor subunit alpha-10-like [Glandiceps talaboti]